MQINKNLSGYYCSFVLNNYRKAIKGLKYIIIALFTLFWVFYAVPAILLRIPYIQKQVTGIATTELSARLKVPVKVESVDIEWLNRLVLENIYIEDQNGETLFVANYVSAGFEVLPLLKGKILFSTVRLFGLSVHLTKEIESSPLNLQFVIDAFAGQDTIKKNPNIDLRFNSILIRKGNFRYDVKSAPETPDKFNDKHIDIRNLSAKISMKAFNKDSLNAHIKKMSFEERSGFVLEKLALNITANKDSAFLNKFEVKLPKTNLKINQMNVDLTKVHHPQDLLDHAPVSLQIPSSHICLKDFSALVPVFRNFAETIELSAEASGFVNNINLKEITLKYSDKMLFIGRMDLKGITHPEEAYLFGRVNKMYITTGGINGLVNNFNAQPVNLPAPIINLGTINFTGEISGFFDNLVAYGKFSSSIGSIETDLIIGKEKGKDVKAYLSGHLSTSELRLNELFPENSPFGPIRLDVHLDMKRAEGEAFKGYIKGSIHEFEYKKYRYENILLSGDFKKNHFNGKIEIDDPNGKLYAEGLFLNKGEKSQFRFASKVEHVRPDSLRLTDKYENPDISFSLTTDFSGSNIDNIEGSIRLDSLTFNTTPDSFFLKQLEIKASGYAEDRRLTVQSDIFNGEVIGAYSFKTIVPSFMQTLKEYLPALVNVTQKKQQINENNFSLFFAIENTEKISNTLKLPVTLLEKGEINGHYNNQYDRFRLEVDLPRFNIGSSLFEDGSLILDNPEDKVNMLLKATNYNKNESRNFFGLKLEAKENRIDTKINWSNNNQRIFKSDISFTTLFSEEKREKGTPFLRTEITLNESPLTLNDSTWHITPTQIIHSEGRTHIQDFSISKGDEYLYMDGYISKDPKDTLLLDLNKIELSYIFDILNIPVLQFGGQATGKFNITDLHGSRMLNTDLEVQNFSFNQVPLGKLNLFSEWDDEQQGIMMLGSIYKNDTTWTDVNGYIYPVGKNAGLSLYFSAKDLDLAFLHPFVENVAKDIRGRGFGNVHLYGPFSELNVVGDAYVLDGGLGIEYLNTYYTFSDSLYLRNNGIFGQDILIYDKYGNSGNVNIDVKHKHFKDLRFDIGIKTDRMLVYDAPQKQNPLIFGTVFGTGTATVAGNEQVVNFDINMQSDPQTAITLDFMNNSTATEYDFITFADKQALQRETDSIPPESIRKMFFIPQKNEGTELRMNFLLDITPDAKIDLVMDPIADDKISGNCSGSLQIQYGTKTDLRMYGNMGIVNGKYNFSLQQLIHKDFKIRDGSSISFRGDPFEATMNMKAIYNVTANIQDLDQSLVGESARRNIPVNCVLNLDGMLRNPNISFDIELPGSNEELERQVKSLVDTRDMMTRQVIYLLVLNKFYTPDYTINPYASNDFSAVASSALSSQISSLMNSFTDKIQLGTNIRTSQDGIEDTEVEMLLSSQLLNNRLIFNGNFGYKNNATHKNAFIGEFDLEYLLTPGGEIRLKAYNHANDMYMFVKQALTTQGAGIMYKKDFTRFSDIFHTPKRLFLPIFRKKNKNNDQESDPK